MKKKMRFILLLAVSAILIGCVVELPATSSEPGAVVTEHSKTADSPTISSSQAMSLQTRLDKLSFKTERVSGLGNSITNLTTGGLIVGDQKQLYTVEYDWGSPGEDTFM